tara:strand:- start:1897 stop:2301 length:405 start_codon:yes stop_codon:yes gene_type:complete
VKSKLQKEKEKTWVLFSRYIRLRDCLKTTGSPEWGECVSCNETKPFNELDAGHFRPKRSGNYFSERGVNAQCQKCNRFLGANVLEYRRAIVRMYGEGVDEELEEEQRHVIRFTISGLKELQESIKQKLKELGVS